MRIDSANVTHPAYTHIRYKKTLDVNTFGIRRELNQISPVRLRLFTSTFLLRFDGVVCLPSMVGYRVGGSEVTTSDRSHHRHPAGAFAEKNSDRKETKRESHKIKCY